MPVCRDGKNTGSSKAIRIKIHTTTKSGLENVGLFTGPSGYLISLKLDIEQLNDDDSVEVKKRSLKRELYAQGALIMFKPFRTLADLCGPSDLNWWAAYLRFRPLLEKDDRSVTILGNMQNFYVSFCRSGNSAA